ncbi:inositol monophosphatase family protein [Nocardioides antri]|uniref:Inositol-1-monophosphatase n=1 Tax=Nocardioides antri TaxID=2607659 RepID=A0A5B1M9F8_9ACTN|nr:inositol monophosphatase family protein [Nocardioides antri]KAA1429076.1 inositol monophosphatase [Nocardioides antri]
MTAQPRELADLALKVAQEAAALVLDHKARGGGSDWVADTKSSDVDVVTLADRASEDLIRDRLLSARPDDALLGEEGDDVVGTSGVRWIVDPIDGTVNFLYGLPEFSVSIAAEVDGEVVAGVVLDAAKERSYVGFVDAGLPGGGAATRNGVPLAVRGPAPVSQRLLATGFSYSAEKRAVQAAATARMLPLVRDIRRHGSCALELCHVAEGALDGYVEEGVNLWDFAAGGLIARLAGAQLVVLPGAGGTDLVVCGPDHGFEELVALARKSGFTRE